MGCANRYYRVSVFTIDGCDLTAVLMDATIETNVTRWGDITAINQSEECATPLVTGGSIESNHIIETAGGRNFEALAGTHVSVTVTPYPGAVSTTGTYAVESATYNISPNGHTGRMRLRRVGTH